MISLGISKTGLVRQRNEDRFYAQGPLLIVADGMGGYTGGEYASTMVVDALVNVVEKSKEVSAHVLRNAILEANHMVYRKSQSYKELEGMGTTAVVAYVQNNILYWAHVGDSRLYIWRKRFTTHDKRSFYGTTVSRSWNDYRRRSSSSS